jgi:hypothetical protein
MSVWDFDDNDEVDEEYVAAQRAKRKSRGAKRPVRSEARASSKPPRPSAELPVQREGATAVAKAPIATTDLSPVICKAQTTVRHPRDHPDESLRGKPILDADGARQYRPCEARAMKGQEVCVSHGGNAPQAQKAAKLRLLAATEPLIAELIAIARDNRLPAGDRTRAIVAALDRAGFRAGLDLNVEAPGWMRMLAQEFGESAQHSPDRTDVVEAEVVEPEPLPTGRTELRELLNDAMARQSPGYQEEADASGSVTYANAEPGYTGDSPHGAAVNVGSSDEAPPAKWGLPRNGRVRR